MSSWSFRTNANTHETKPKHQAHTQIPVTESHRFPRKGRSYLAPTLRAADDDICLVNQIKSITTQPQYRLNPRSQRQASNGVLFPRLTIQEAPISSRLPQAVKTLFQSQTSKHNHVSQCLGDVVSDLCQVFDHLRCFGRSRMALVPFHGLTIWGKRLSGITERGAVGLDVVTEGEGSIPIGDGRLVNFCGVHDLAFFYEETAMKYLDSERYDQAAGGPRCINNTQRSISTQRLSHSGRIIYIRSCHFQPELGCAHATQR